MDHMRHVSLTPSPTHQNERSGSPNKRPRNAKNLSINTTGISTKQAAHTTFAGNPLSRTGESSTSSLPAVPNSKILPTAIPNHVSSAGVPQVGKDSAARPFSEPSSPSYIGPAVQPPRRSKLGLTITTSDPKGLQSQTIPDTPSRPLALLPLRSTRSDLGSGKLNSVPETPALGPLSAMREGDGQPLFSPSMAPNGGMQLPPFGNSREPTLPTPSFGPEGGMQFPSRGGSTESSPYMRTARPPLDIPRHAFQSPQSSSVIQHTVEHHPSTPLHELPLSREAKTPGYPEGPICIYPPSVYLYHQPTRKECREFDVIINVAKEVSNPFLEPEDSGMVNVIPEPRYKDAGVQCTILTGPEKGIEKVPSSAASEKSFSSALENVPSDDEGPATPKAVTPKHPDPEYIHLPWEHNSKVYEDWLRVCELIDNRVMKGKRVLIHCQLGVSRSASLIVAYGLYKNPRLSPDEAREQAKRQSKFIDLNMHFMYELGDFKKLLAEKFPAPQVQKRPGGQMGLSRAMTESVLTVRHQPAADPMSPIADEAEEGSELDKTSPHETQFATAPNVDSTTAGPSSAPVGMAWSPAEPSQDYSQSQERFGGSSFVSQPSRDEPMEVEAAHVLSAEPTDKAPFMLKPPIKKARTEHHTEAVSSVPVSSVPPQAVNLLSEAEGVHVENKAKDTDSLPPPNLDFSKISKSPVLASKKSKDSLSPSPPNFSLPSNTPRHSLRPMPSLPAGFNGMLPKRSLQSQLPLSGGLSVNIPSLQSSVIQGEFQPEILSPRAAEFTANPFHQTVAGDLVRPSSQRTGATLQPPQASEFDPRSPPTRGEAPIIRNIDDILG
ncbi:hypothetical protein MMC10_003792 [Thelotrema lepadinum]|nr:hypothetical protein [Thelotrema lepadinum]